jgi:hypothetical protein
MLLYVIVKYELFEQFRGNTKSYTSGGFPEEAREAPSSLKS